MGSNLAALEGLLAPLSPAERGRLAAPSRESEQLIGKALQARRNPYEVQ